MMGMGVMSTRDSETYGDGDDSAKDGDGDGGGKD